jgi:hypothetical protein
MLHVGPGFDLPLEAVTETFALLAVGRAGKSNAAVVMAEEMYKNGLPWVAVDPKGDWWGMRSDSTGRKPGLPIPIFGGLHGDLPLEAESGKFIAELVDTFNLTCILDVSDFPSKASQTRFLTEFAQTLFRLHAKSLQPRHLFLEEADEYLPQMVRGDQAKCVNAWTLIVKRGRQRGLGCSIISQRSASVNKDVLSQAQTLFALRTTGANDRKAILGWIDYYAESRTIVDDLPKLSSGIAWVVSPQWLQIAAKHKFRRRETFDSGATPEVGKKRKVATLADIDLGSLKTQMAASIERAQGDDPKILRKKIVELEQKIKTQKPTVETVTVEKIIEIVPDWVTSIEKGLQSIDEELQKLREQILVSGSAKTVREDSRAPVVSQPLRIFETPERKVSRTDSQDNGEIGLGRCERAILSVLAQFPQGRSRQQVATLSEYSGRSSGFANSLSRLRTLGFIEGRGDLRITGSGSLAIEGNYEPLATGPELLQHWLGKLGKCESAILRTLVDVWPKSMDKNDIAAATNYSPTSSGFANSLSKLRGLELIEGRGELKADDTLAREVKQL